METREIYNIDREKTGKINVRGEKLLPGEYHNVIHICIFNSRNEMLIQRRCLSKNRDPGMWDVSVAGTAVTGENQRQTASREAREELGIILDFSGKRSAFTVNHSPCFDDFYLVVADIDVSKLTLQEEEVMDAKWASREEIENMTKSGEYIKALDGFYDYIFSLKDYLGVKDVFRGYVNQ